MFSMYIILSGLTVRNLSSTMTFPGGRQSVTKDTSTADIHVIRCWAPVRAFLEQEGQLTVFRYLWLRSGLFKSTSPSHLVTNEF